MVKKFTYMVYPILVITLLSSAVLIKPPLVAAEESQEEELFLVAQKAFDDGFYDVAIRYIDQFLLKYPQTKKLVEAQLLLGQCYFFKSQYLKAYDTFQKLLQYTEYKDATLFWLGETYYKGSDYKQAEEHYRQLIEVYPDSVYVPQTLYSLGWTYYEQKDYKKSKSVFITLIKKFPAHQLSEDALFKVAEAEHNTGSYEIASQYFQNYVIKYPKSTRHAEAYFYIAEDYYYLADYLTAATYYAKAADIGYDHKLQFMAKVSLGWCYLKLGKYELSKKYFNEAETISDEQKILTDDIYLGQASLYSEMEDNEKAFAAYSNLIEKFPDSPRIAEAHLGKANILYALKNYEQAINEYQLLIDQYSEDSSQKNILEKAYYGLAWTHLRSGNIDQSIKNFETIMNKTEDKNVKVSSLTQIGDAYHDIEDYEKAIEVYDRILKNYPDSIYTDYVQFRQGIALLKLNKIEAATLSFQSLKANFPTSKHLNDVEYYLGVAFFKKEDWTRAITHATEYLKVLPQTNTFSSEAHYILALSYFNLEKYNESLQTFQELLTNYPDQRAVARIAELNIAKCLYKLGQFNEAIKHYNIVIYKFADSLEAQDAMLSVGDHYLEKGELDNAIQYYGHFLQNFPGSEKINVVHFELGQAYQAKNELDKALNHYKQITDSAQKEVFAKAKLAIADIFSKESDVQTSIETYQNIIHTVPEFKRDAYIKIARIHELNKTYTEAINAYRSALNAKKALSEIRDAELQFYIGDTFELLNESNKAVEEYLRIPYLYPKETSWIIKAYLRMARIFEEEEKWTDAKLTYTKIIDYQTEESKYAKERVEWINTNAFQN